MTNTHLSLLHPKHYVLNASFKFSSYSQIQCLVGLEEIKRFAFKEQNAYLRVNIFNLSV